MFRVPGCAAERKSNLDFAHVVMSSAASVPQAEKANFVTDYTALLFRSQSDRGYPCARREAILRGDWVTRPGGKSLLDRSSGNRWSRLLAR